MILKTKLTNENQALKDEVQHLMEVREIDNRRINQMEENMGRKKLIIRGLAISAKIGI